MPQAPSAVIAAQSSAAAGARGRKPPLSASPSPLISPLVRRDRDFTTMTTTTMSGAGWANKFSVDGAERCARAADAVRRSRYALSLSLSPFAFVGAQTAADLHFVFDSAVAIFVSFHRRHPIFLARPRSRPPTMASSHFLLLWSPLNPLPFCS